MVIYSGQLTSDFYRHLWHGIIPLLNSLFTYFLQSKFFISIYPYILYSNNSLHVVKKRSNAMPQAPLVTLSSLDYCETIIYKADEYVTPNGMRQYKYQGITLNQNQNGIQSWRKSKNKRADNMQMWVFEIVIINIVFASLVYCGTIQ